MNIKKEIDDGDDSMEIVDTSKDDEGDTSEYNTTGDVTGENIIYVQNDPNAHVNTVSVITEGMEVDGTEQVIEVDENGNATTASGNKMILVLNKGADGDQLELVSSKTFLKTFDCFSYLI